MPLDPGTEAAGLGTTGGERGEDCVRQGDRLAGGEDVVEPAVQVGGWGLAEDGDVRDAVDEDAVDREVTLNGEHGVLGLAVGTSGAALVGEAGGPVVGHRLLFSAGGLIGRGSATFG